MRNHPVFTAVVVVALAFGIGVNTAIFTLLNTLMLRPLPVREPEELVELLSRYPGEPRINGVFFWSAYQHYRQQNHVFSVLVGMSESSLQVGDEAVPGAYVSADFFPALGVKTAIGRVISPGNDDSVAVLSWSFWKSHFAQDSTILGKQIVVNGAKATVIGVTVEEWFGLDVGSKVDVWIPAGMARDVQRLQFTLIGRLKPGVTLAQARAEMTVLDRFRVDEMSRNNTDPLFRQLSIEVEPAATGIARMRDRFAGPVLSLMVIVGLLLLIACTNIASMMLARATARRRELTIRVALGAGRFRLARQVLVESILLSASGAVAGSVLSLWATDGLVRVLASSRQVIPFHIHATPDARVLWFTMSVTLATAMLFGLAPALSASQLSPISSLRQRATAGDTPLRRMFENGLIVVQVAISVVLLAAAVLFASHLSNLRNEDLGFQPNSILLVDLDPSKTGYQRAQLSEPYQALLARLQTISGVKAASLTAMTPIQRGVPPPRFVEVEGFNEDPAKRQRLAVNWVGPNYFEALGTRLMAGRDFELLDANRDKVAIVNESFARYYFGARSPLGKHVALERETRPYEIVGVVSDAKYADLHAPSPRTLYFNAFQLGRIQNSLVIRTSGFPDRLIADVRAVVGDSLKNLTVSKVSTLTDQIDESIVTERLIAMLSGLVGLLGTVLAALGLCGLLLFTVARRTNEIGIRMALGANRREVSRMVMGRAVGLISAGLVLGVPLAFLALRIATTLVEDVAVTVAVPISVALVTLTTVSLLAAYFPARRATRVDPLVALRQD
jgi:predicted permease